ncbi:MAG: carotenoid oxygenase family protein [Cyanobacteria bacterium J06639_14]
MTHEISDPQKYDLLLKSEFFSKLLVNQDGTSLIDEFEVWLLTSKIKTIRVAKGKTIFHQGESGESAYIVVTGNVNGSVEYQEVEETKGFRMGVGTLFGEISLMTGLPRTATIYTEQDVELLELSRETFANLLSLRSQIPEMLSDLVIERQKSDAEALSRLKAINQTEISHTQKRENILDRFLKILIENNFIPSRFPNFTSKSNHLPIENIVSQLQKSEFCQRLLVDENGNSLLSLEELSLLSSRIKLVSFQHGDVIFHQGDSGKTAYIILNGIIKGRVKYQKSYPIKDFEMRTGALFGEISLITGIPRTATIYVEQTADILELSEETFVYLLNLRPEVQEVLADLATQRQATDQVMLNELEYFDDPDIAQKFERSKIIEHLQRMGLDILGLYARVPYAVLNHLSQAASDPTTTETLASLYLTDNFAPVHRERTVDNLTVVGELPAELSGRFLRIGPNPQFPPVGRYHWFDGDGMIHGIELDKGQACYRNRWVRTKGFNIERATGKTIWPGMLNLPRFDLPYGMAFKNAANTALVWHGGKLLALWEIGEPYIIDLTSIETIGPHTFDGKLTCPFTAHPKIDPVTGEMMFFGYSLLTRPYLQYGIVSDTGDLLKIVSIDLPSPILTHDFAITEQYTIFMDMPLKMQGSRIVQGEIPVVFDSEQSSRFGIMPRYGDSSTIRWFEVPTCMVYHTVNAYEEGDEIVLFAYRLSSTNLFIPEYDTGNPLNVLPEVSYLTCWRFNLATGGVQEDRIDDVVTEFPRINPSRVGRKMRYAFAALGATYMAPKPLFDGLKKYDFDTGNHQTYYFGRGRFGGECAFAPRPGSDIEDDGWLLTYVYDAIAQQSEFWVLSAQDITTGPIARVPLPQRIPYGFHCTWVPSDCMSPG